MINLLINLVDIFECILTRSLTVQTQVSKRTCSATGNESVLRANCKIDFIEATVHHFVLGAKMLYCQFMSSESHSNIQIAYNSLLCVVSLTAIEMLQFDTVSKSVT